MLIYNMHRESKFPLTITNLAALFLELFESPSYFCTVMLSTQYSIGVYQTFNVTRVELIRVRHIPETRRALSTLHA